jgi:hypothetical protein
MRKEIKSKSKRKWIVGGGLFFGGIALLTTGFATWIVGTQITANDQQTTVTIDTVDNQSLIFESTLTNSDIHIGEATTTDASLPVRVQDGKATDFKITINFKITKSKTVKTPTLIKITLNGDYNDNEAGNKVLKTATDFEVKHESDYTTTGHTQGETYTYIDLKTVTINLDQAWEDDPTNPSMQIYSVTGLDIQLFDWGTYFGGAAPTAYYKAKAPTEEAALRTFVNTAGEELKAMSQKFTAPEGKNTIIPIKLELYTPAD